MPMASEDLIELDRAGRRCAVCRSARGWRGFEVVRLAGRDPIVLCAGCRPRFAETLPPAAESAPVPAAEERRPPEPKPEPAASDRKTAERADRLRAALVELPSSFSTAMAARAARLSTDKVLARLQELEDRGEVRRVGKRWSTEAPPSELTAAIDRLESRTTNLRIVRERTRIG
jgi:hypothetical protein